MKTLLMEIVTLVLFWPLRIVSVLFGRRANQKVRGWQDSMWTWGLGGAAIGYMVGTDQFSGPGADGGAGFDPGQHHGGPHDGGGIDGGGFGGDIGSF